MRNFTSLLRLISLPGKAIFAPPKPVTPQLPPAPDPVPTAADPEVKKSKDKARVQAGRRQGLLSTNLTKADGGLGDLEDSSKKRATLLGG